MGCSGLSWLSCVAVCCSVLQCVAVCGSVLQCVAVCCSAVPPHQRLGYSSVLIVGEITDGKID